MAAKQFTGLVRYIRRFAQGACDENEVDAELLNRFIVHREESAFTTLVQRYGPLVLGVCRRVLGNQQDAEDAFQATFLVLLLKARPLANPSRLASWLYGVAYYTAKNARNMSVRRMARERNAADMSGTKAAVQDQDLWELQSVLDEELNRLPEKYRLPVILCELQGISRKEVARRLGCPEGTLSSRLARARERLQARFAKRGLTLSAAALATALSRDVASAAVPATLAASTVNLGLLVAAASGLGGGLVPLKVAVLTEGALKSLFLAKVQLATGVLVASSLLVGVGLLWGQVAPPRQVSVGQNKAGGQGTSVAAAQQQTKETVMVKGRVLDPDGKPVAGAKLFALKVPKDPPRNELDLVAPERGVSGTDGRFQIEMPAGDMAPSFPLPNNRELPLVAMAVGYGMGWTGLPKDRAPGELKISLVKDEPIQGRIVNTEGKPLAGVEVSVVGVAGLGKNGLQGFLDAWKRMERGGWFQVLEQETQMVALPVTSIVKTVTTDTAGKFQINALGADRVAMLMTKGQGLTGEMFFVLTRAGLDLAPANAGARENGPEGRRGPGLPPKLYGPSFDLVAVVGRVIEGAVREAGSGKPVPGIAITSASGSGQPVRAISDAQGRYRLAGLAKADQYIVFTLLDEKSSWLRGTASVPDMGGLEPLKADIALARGVFVRGRVVDKQTGKGVMAGIRFVPLPGNEYFDKPGYDSHRHESLMESTDAEGRFRLTVMPGKVLAMAQVTQANGKNPYRRAVADPDYKELFQDKGGLTASTAGNGVELLGTENTCKVLDLKPGVEANVELLVDRGKTAQIAIRDPDGKPLEGCWVSGVTASWPIAFKVPEAQATIYALNPDKPRNLAVYHVEKKLGGMIPIRGDEIEPVIAKLGSMGKITGRFLQDDGSPLEGATVAINPDSEIVSELYRFAAPKTEATVTDKDGKFTLDDILPGMSFGFQIAKGKQSFQGKPRLGTRQLKPGENLDLGDRKLEPRGQ